MERLIDAMAAIAHAAHMTGILVAAVAGFLIGWLWHLLFGRVRRKALAADALSNVPERHSPWLFGLAFVATLLMAAMLQGVLVHSGLWGAKDGMISAAFLWTGFVLTTLGLSLGFQGRPAAVIAIDTGHWLIVLLAMGAIIGAFGPA